MLDIVPNIPPSPSVHGAAVSDLVQRHAGGYAIMQQLFARHSYLLQLYLLLQFTLYGSLGLQTI